ncbi:hypothetical protein ACS0TY_004531 [Phlomoides rotata]
MAYAALINLSKTNQLVELISQDNNVADYFPDDLEYPEDEIAFLEEVIEKLDGKSRDDRLEAFYVKIREAVHGYEDVLDALASNLLQIAQADESTGNKHPAIYVEEIRQGFNFFVETVKRVNEELEYPLPEDDEDDGEENESDFDGKKLGSINSEDDGDGDDEENESDFDGKKLGSINSEDDGDGDADDEENESDFDGKKLGSINSEDDGDADADDEENESDFDGKKLGSINSEDDGDADADDEENESDFDRKKLGSINSEDDGDGDGDETLWPRELEKPGKLIAENCDGLPLTIVTVASLLSKAEEKIPEYWNEVANEKNSVFELAYLEISEVLYPSYKKLDLVFRACFLYMAAFRVKYEIPISKLYMLYRAEGIIPKEGSRVAAISFIDQLEQKFQENSVVLSQFICNKINTFRLHSVFWHFCVREARNDKFCHVLKRRADGLTEDIEKHRRLCVQNNVLFAIKDVYDSIASVSAARSLLCFGLPHPYQVPLCLEMKLLKVLDALTIRFYEFPVGIFKLILLRYLALTYNTQLPAEISQLWCLEFLIIHRHMSIKFPGDLSFLPKEIWDMKKLKHLEIMGGNLPHPPDNDAILVRLATLLDVSAESCTKSILERIPYLEKLGIRIELAPDHASDPSFSFDHISCLECIESLKCVIVNPELKSEVVVAPPASLSMLPSRLKELTLSGFGYDWEHIRPIAMLPNLEELELQCYAFRGAAWVMHEGDFKRLRYLLLEDTDLVEWRAYEDCHLLSLRNLIIRQGYKLKEIPWQSLPRFCETELVDCNPSASQKMKENHCKIICSWVEDRKSTLANEQHLRSKGTLVAVYA